MDRLRAATEAALRSWGPDAGRANRSVLIDEWPLETHAAPIGQPLPIDSFEERFASILQLGARDWVHLNLVSAMSDSALFVLEYFTTPLRGKQFQSDDIVVNISGPCVDAEHNDVPGR